LGAPPPAVAAPAADGAMRPPCHAGGIIGGGPPGRSPGAAQGPR
jgi:hypothetical protein